jgi:hypothetical protein
MHNECVDIPFKLLLKGAYYHDLKDKDYADLLYMFDQFKLMDPRIDY